MLYIKSNCYLSVPIEKKKIILHFLAQFSIFVSKISKYTTIYRNIWCIQTNDGLFNLQF